MLAVVPAVGLAQEAGLAPGGAARIANAGGDTVLLREGPGYDAGALDALVEGTPLTVTDGPITAEDGSVWFGVDAGGRGGYVVSDFLAPAAAAAAPPAAPDPAAETVAALAAPPAPAAPAAGETATAREGVNLRAEPNGEAPVLAVVPPGGVVERTGDAAGGYLPIAYQGVAGYAAVEFLTLGGGPAATETVTNAQPAVPQEAGAAPAGSGAATATDAVNLRAGPGLGEAVLLVVPAGAELTPTGEAAAGYLGVEYQGTRGWVDAAYLARPGPAATVADAQPVAGDAAASPAGAPPSFEPGTAPAGTPAAANELVNLRQGPGYDEPILRVLPPGGEVVVTGGASEGFLPVWYNGTEGWIDGQYLDLGDGGRAPGVEAPELAAPAAPSVAPSGGGGLVWPVSGGTWEVMQGYNGSSHQNSSSAWQYYYSLDLVREDGATAGQPVTSPANGTVRWLDPSTGGISIDIGDGHAVALFHVAIDGGIQEGDPVGQGQYLGTISGPGGPGFVGSPHLHFTLWQTGDGGNWDRTATPFVGEYAISGMEFPDTGGSNQHRGTTFTP